MTHPHPLTPAQLRDLKNILEQRHDLLQKQENLDFRNLVKTATDGIDDKREEFSAPTTTASAEQKLSARHHSEIADIVNALLRIEQGTYAMCIDCQSDIDFPRLLAYATALRCMNCQEAFELAEKRAGSWPN
jgi:DnaK suppressor protein